MFKDFGFCDDFDEEGYDVILVDGMNLLHRAARSYSDLSIRTESGEEILTGATFGFLALVKGIWEKYSRGAGETSLYVCWDGGYRHRIALFPDYKASRRAKSPEEKEPHIADIPKQRKAVGKILQLAGWRQAVADGFEADDVMATLAKTYGEKKVAIYTMDQDLHQCVTKNVHVVSAKWGSVNDTIWDLEAVVAKWGVPPSRVPEMKGLAGDSGDGIPGCPGCGEGWAKKMLGGGDPLPEVIARAKVATLAGTYQGTPWKTPSLTKKIVENEELILTSWELAKVVDDVPIQLTHPPADFDKLRSVFERLEFHSLLQPNVLSVLRQIA